MDNTYVLTGKGSNAHVILRTTRSWDLSPHPVPSLHSFLTSSFNSFRQSSLRGTWFSFPTSLDFYKNLKICTEKNIYRRYRHLKMFPLSTDWITYKYLPTSLCAWRVQRAAISFTAHVFNHKGMMYSFCKCKDWQCVHCLTKNPTLYPEFQTRNWNNFGIWNKLT